MKDNLLQPNSMIDYRQALALLIWLLSGQISLSLPRHAAISAGRAGWMLVIITGCFGLISYFFLMQLFKKYPQQNLIQIAKKLTGSWIGTGFGIVLSFYFISYTALILREFAEIFIISMFPHTPLSVIVIMLLIIIGYGTFYGADSICRITWFIMPYLVVGALFAFISAIPNYNFPSLLPVFGPGIKQILKGSTTHLSLFSGILVLGMLAPQIREQDKVPRVGLLSMIISIVINTIITAILIMTFNASTTGKLIFPAFQIARLITITEYLQRLEAIFVFLWFFTAAVLLNGLFLGAIISCKQTFNLKNRRGLLLILMLVLLVLSLLPFNNPNWSFPIRFITMFCYPVIFFGIPFILWICSLFSSKAGDSHQ